MFITSVYCVLFIVIVIQLGQLVGNFIISYGMSSLIWLGSRIMDIGSKKATLATRMGYLDFLYGTYYKGF